MPQPKKDPSTRARVNRASTAAKLANGVTVIRPPLPERRDAACGALPWQPLTLEWWNDLWASPMAAEYHSSDKHALFILAALVDAFWIEPSKELAAEIRLQRQAFGLTPYDRRRLEWTIVTTENVKDDRANQKRPRTSRQPRAKTDPRLGLAQ